MQHRQEIGVNSLQETSKCGKIYNLYAKLVHDAKIDEEFKKKNFKSFPPNNKLICNCGYEIDLSGIKNEIETQVGKKIIV